MALFRETVAQPMDCHAEATVCSGTNCLVPPDDFNAILSLILSSVLTVMLAFVMFSMGCSVELYKFLGHLRRPWGISIGFLCQFGIMPFTAFILSLAFNVLPVQAVVIIIMGCCPGGSGSNIICYYLDGDMDLSISMTACSSILALGMMPLCLLIYTSLWVSPETILIPYDSIGITLVALLVPIGFGMLVKHKWPQTAKKILKIGSIAGFILIVVIAVVGGILYQSSWDIDPALWIIGTVFPFIGGGLGFFFARFTGQPWYRCRSIAVETGFQNAQLCSTITQLSFSPADLEIMFSFPLIYTIFQMVAAILTVATALSNFAGEGLHGMLLFAWTVPQYGIKLICLHGDKHGMPASQVTGQICRGFSGFQLYKRKCRGEVSEDSESPYQGDGEVGAGKIKALENGGFELNEDSLEKSKDYDMNMQF